jgi:hypothetical protein
MTYQYELEKMLIQQYQHFHDEKPKNHLQKSFFDEILGLHILLYDTFDDHIKISDIQRISQLQNDHFYWSYDNKGRKIPIYEGKHIKAIMIDTSIDLAIIQSLLS